MIFLITCGGLNLGVMTISSGLGVEFPALEGVRTFLCSTDTVAWMCSEFFGYSHLRKNH